MGPNLIPYKEMDFGPNSNPKSKLKGRGTKRNKERPPKQINDK